MEKQWLLSVVFLIEASFLRKKSHWLLRLLKIWPSYRPWGKKGVDLCRAFMSTFLSYILIVTSVCPKVIVMFSYDDLIIYMCVMTVFFSFFGL